MDSLHWADFLIFSLFLIVSILIGLYHAFTGGRQKTTQEFIMANRKLGVLPTMLSLLVSFQSAILIIGYTAEIYLRGTQLWLGAIISTSVAILIAERLIVPWLYPLRLTSVFEYFELRFQSKLVRRMGAVYGMMNGVLYIGPAILAPSIALEAATGFPTMVTIPLMALVATVYTALVSLYIQLLTCNSLPQGGIRAVVWTDVFQSAVMFAGMMAVLIKGCIDVGGVKETFKFAKSGGRLLGFEWSGDPRFAHTFWTLMFGWGLTWVNMYGLQQASIQRYSATSSITKARLSLLLNIPGVVLMLTVSMLEGVVVFAYFYKAQCDPITKGYIHNPNQLLSYFVKTIFSSSVGFSGLFLATLYSGALSSVSSSLSGCAANLWVDILKPTLPNVSEFKATLINKCAVVVYGLIGTGVAYLAASVPGPITQITQAFQGGVIGPLTGMFLLGGCFKRAEWKGACIGGLCGLVMSMWISIGSQLTGVRGLSQALPPIPSQGCQANVTLYRDVSLNDTAKMNDNNQINGVDNVYAISYLLYALMGAMTTVIVGLAVSYVDYLCWRADKRPIPEHLFIPWYACIKWSQPTHTEDHTTEHEDCSNTPMLTKDRRTSTKL